jgi:apolipoprotein D and lipocalin family protein
LIFHPLRALGLAAFILGSQHTLANPASTPPALAALPSLDVDSYMGQWYQVALYPNRFQRQCVSDTTATYSLRGDGLVQVVNRCRNAAGEIEDVTGVARPVGTLQNGRLQPAQLQVSFLPTWLRWLPIGWGRYWVIKLADDQRYAVVSEPGREYLWVLARRPRLEAADEREIQAFLRAQGFDLTRLQLHRHASP